MLCVHICFIYQRLDIDLYNYIIIHLTTGDLSDIAYHEIHANFHNCS